MASPKPDSPSPEALQRISQVLTPEYGLLMASLGASWSASLVRTSIFLAILGAAGVALGFAAQTGVDSPTFRTLALVVLPVVLFLGIATFVRLVQVQRESIVIITGLNRIRHVFQLAVPEARPYYVLPAHDDIYGLYRSPGTGMPRRLPRFQLVYLVVQTQGVVGLVNGVVAGAIAALALEPFVPGALLLVGFVAFILTVAATFLYWQHEISELSAALRPINPTPPDEIDAPI
ncbi:MAG: hypothetical protein FIA92_14875 [Chloroflexi bacterium]|nr:hypothetical protein [Chloroflexota bacterium]